MKALFIILFSVSYGLAADFNPALPQVLPQSTAKNTFIFWLNGDSDRFRPQQGIGSDIIRLDALDAARIRQYSKSCECNIVVFHDQRGSNSWYTNSTHFSAFLYAFSNGRPVAVEKKRLRIFGKQMYLRAKRKGIKKYYKKYRLEFDEVNQAKVSFLTRLLLFSKGLFPNTNYHLIYRGHSFASATNMPIAPFDYSHEKTPYHINHFTNAIKRSGVFLSTITMAACSMAYIELVLKLQGHAKYLVASQVNIHETGRTGFSFRFLKTVKNTSSKLQIAKEIAKTLLINFRYVKDRELFMRETPLALIDVSRLNTTSSELKRVESIATKKVRKNPEQFSDFLVSSKVSQRYINLRRSEGLSPLVEKLIKQKMQSNDGNQTAYDFIGVIESIGYESLAKQLKRSIKQYDYSAFSYKQGLSFDVTF